jgi:hypothetical protein
MKRKKGCHSGKNQKTCPHENGDEYFLIFTRNPLFPSFFDLLNIDHSLG